MRSLFYILIFLLLPVLLKAQPDIHIVAATDTICNGTFADFTASTSGTSYPYYQWTINGINTGTDSTVFTTDSLHNGDIVFCRLTNSTGDTILATSDSITITVIHIPSAGIIIGPGEVCLYATMILTDSVTGGVWGATNSNARDSSGFIKGLSVMQGFESKPGPAPDTITYIVSNSCGSDTTYKPIQIEPLPDAYFEFGGGPNCIGNGALINNGYGINGYIYATNSNASVSSLGVSFNHVGYDLIVCVDSGYCGISRDSLTIYISSTPTITPIISSSTVLCAGLPITLTDSSAIMYSSGWRISNNNAHLSYVNIYTDRLTGTMPGLDTITFDLSNQCGSASSSIVVTVTPPYPIENISNVCTGKSYIIHDSTTGGMWSSTDTIIAIINPYTGVITGISQGIDSIKYTLPNGCFATTAVTVNESPSPISVLPNLICIDSAISLPNTSQGIWSVDTSFSIAYTLHDMLYGKNPGYARLFYTIPDGCYDSIVIGVIDCGIFENIFPNPSTDEVTIQVNTRLYFSYSFTNIIGQVLFQQPINSPLTTVDISFLPPGVYIITLYGDRDRYVTKFVKK